MRKLGNRLVGGALVAWLLALVSCGTMATAPRLEPAAGPEQAVTKPTNPTPHEGLIGDLIGPARVPPPLVDDGVRLVKQVLGSQGDTLTVGDVKLVIPPDAFDGTAEISVTVPDPLKLECHLEINPPQLNHFDVPVRLEFDVAGASDPRVMVVFWYDESGACWIPLDTTIDTAKRTIWTELPHFSIYKADSEVQTRAGW